MKKILLITVFSNFCFAEVMSQSNCSNPTLVNICPVTPLLGETNAGAGDDAASSCNLLGEDKLYKITAPNGASKIFVSITNATASLRLIMRQNSCLTGTCMMQSVAAGNSNATFIVSSVSNYYLWVDASTTITYDIAIGGDTDQVWVNIPNTQGNFFFNPTTCATPLFLATKPFFQVKFNGIFKTYPLTLSPLGVAGTMCISTYFRNTTGIEGIKKFRFYFPATGFSNVIAGGAIPGFYNAGSWVPSFSNGNWTYEFFDAAGTGKGDFTGTPNTCLRYEFCFSIIPLSNSPSLTNIRDSAWSDGFGQSGFSGYIHYGCCPSPNPNCLGNSGGNAGSGTTHAFGFGFNDPGSPLPVTLTDFSAWVRDDKVELTWTTVAEVNNDFFTAEKSKDGIEWVEVVKIKGAGNSTSPIHYKTTDEMPFYGTSFYRLVQTDFNGSFVYFKTVKVFLEEPAPIHIYPNPAQQFIFISIPEKQETELVSLVVSDALGSVVMQKNISISDGKIKVDIESFHRGFYSITVISDNGF